MAVPTPTYTEGDWGYDTYTEDGTTYARIVSYSGTGGSGVTITIPSTVGGYVVKEIGKGGSQEGIFDNNTVSVNTILGPFPDSITAFNDYSFYSNIKVKIDMSMGLPANLTKIGAYAFYGAQTCYGDLIIPAGVTTIGSYAFQSGGYTSIQIPAGIQSIGAGAFTYCTSVTVVRFLSSSAPSLGSECFGLNLPVPPSAPAKTYLVQSVGNWASTVLNSYGNSKTQFTYEVLPMYEHLMFNGNKVQIDSAIRDANGVRIDTNYQRTLISGTNIKTINNESLLGSGNITVGGVSLEAIYPVGSIYMNASNSTNPATLLGFGVWERFGNGKVMVGVSESETEFNTVEKTGGEKAHTLTTTEMPSHNHGVTDPKHGHGVTDPGHGHGVTDPGHSHSLTNQVVWGGGSTDAWMRGNLNAYSSHSTGSSTTGISINGAGTGISINSAGTGISINNSGGGASHNNLQPYITVYMWKRTA